jgi:hypothetical protein
VSLSALIDQLDCRVILDKYLCVIQERQTGQKIGARTRRRGLWYMDRGGLGLSRPACTMMEGEKETLALVYHCRMGHVSFDKIAKWPAHMRGRHLNSKFKCVEQIIVSLIKFAI